MKRAMPEARCSARVPRPSPTECRPPRPPTHPPLRPQVMRPPLLLLLLIIITPTMTTTPVPLPPLRMHIAPRQGVDMTPPQITPPHRQCPTTQLLQDTELLRRHLPRTVTGRPPHSPQPTTAPPAQYRPLEGDTPHLAQYRPQGEDTRLLLMMDTHHHKGEEEESCEDKRDRKRCFQSKSSEQTSKKFRKPLGIIEATYRFLVNIPRPFVSLLLSYHALFIYPYLCQIFITSNCVMC